MSARIPYMFAVSRFAHYLKCMVRDKIGSTKEKDQLERWLNNWIIRYVDGDPKNSSEETKARSRSPAPRSTVVPNEENPGYYSANVLAAAAFPARRHGHRHEPCRLAGGAQELMEGSWLGSSKGARPRR